MEDPVQGGIAASADANSPDILLELRHVSQSFPGADRPALDDVSLQVRGGDFIAIVGPSGSGKSTLLNILGLLDRPGNGTYIVNGRDTTTLSERARDALRSRVFGFVFQSSHVLGDDSVATNAALGLRIQHVPVAERHQRSMAALELLGLSHRVTARAKLLSGGERQRLAIARAVATRPEVILADEPTGNLDSHNSRIVIEHLRSLHRAGTTVILITHAESIARQADRLWTITDGRITQLDTSAPLSTPDTPPTSRPPDRKGDAATSSPWWDDAVDALSSMSSRFLRTVLLMAAFAVGIGGLLAATGLSQTAALQISDRLSAAALDEVVIDLTDPDTLHGPDLARLSTWSEAFTDLPAVVQAGHVATVSPGDVTITRHGPRGAEPTAPVSLATASSTYLDLADLPLAPASARHMLDSPDARVAWVSTAAAQALELPTPASGVLSPGYQIWIGGIAVDVLGTFEVPERAAELTTSVMASPAVLAGMTEAPLRLVIRTETGYPYQVAQAAPLVIAPESPGNVQPRTVADLRELRAGVTDDLSAFIGVLSAVLLVLAVISASTAMYLSVQARTQEIALRRAIGTGRGMIARLFVLEGAIVGLAGGAVGAAAGTAVVLALSMARNWTPVIPPETIPLALALGVVAGVLSSLYPGWVASRQRPADALRG